MKHIYTFFLCFLLLFGWATFSFAQNTSISQPKLVGTWYIDTDKTIEDICQKFHGGCLSKENEAIKNQIKNIFFKFNADGTCHFGRNRDDLGREKIERSGTWELSDDNNLIITDDKLKKREESAIKDLTENQFIIVNKDGMNIYCKR